MYGKTRLLSVTQTHYACYEDSPFEYNGITNFGPNGEQYFMPTSRNICNGKAKLHRYSRPFSGVWGSGSTGIKEYFVRIPGVPLGGGSNARTGALQLFVHSDTSLGTIWLPLSSHKATIMRSTTSGKYETVVTTLFFVSL